MVQLLGVFLAMRPVPSFANRQQVEPHYVVKFGVCVPRIYAHLDAAAHKGGHQDEGSVWYTTNVDDKQLNATVDSFPKAHFGEHFLHVGVQYPVKGLLLLQADEAGVHPPVLMLVVGRSDPGKPLLPGSRIPHSHPFTSRFTPAILTVVYIPPHADEKTALDVIYTATNTLNTKFPESLFIVASDFNQTSLKQVMPKYHQHISCPTRGPNILDHCYTTIKDVNNSIPCPHFGKSDHSTVFLLPANKQKLKWENPSRKELQCWSEAAEDRLQDCLDS
eukprot:g46635.t1